MRIDAIVQLAGSGNLRTVEEEWLNTLTNEEATPQQWLEWVPVAEALAAADKAGHAAELALATVESLRDRFEPAEVLPVARAMLLALNQCDELRDAALELYLAAHTDRPNVIRLIEEAGLKAGRTSRRAIRTLDMCLALRPGSYLVERHSDAAARVQGVDAQSWRVAVATAFGTAEFEPTRLADTYVPVEADDFRALKQFDPARLSALLESDPVPLVRSIVRSRGDRMTADALEALLTPRLVAPDRWAKWWSNVRSQLKRTADMRIEGRSPCVLVYDPNALTPEEQTRSAFRRTQDSVGSVRLLEEYLRECRARKTDPDAGLMGEMADELEARARRQQSIGNRLALESLLIAARARRARGEGDPASAAVEFLRTATDPADWIRAIEIPDLWVSACECLEQARPGSASDLLAQLLRVAPTTACDAIACRLAGLGFAGDDFDELVQEIVAEPIEHFGALMWLWDGPSPPDVLRSLSPPALLHRILSMLAELKRSDTTDPAVVRAVRAGVRPALSARKYERFRMCLTTMDLGTASMLNTQVRRLEDLGPAVKGDLRKLILERYPEIDARPKVDPWVDPNVLYVTARGMGAKEAEIHELVNVKMRENAKAIGAAAEHGDLSENSEYKFALEERDLLRARLAQMNAEMVLARILEPDDVPTDRVGIGSRVTLRHADSGEAREMTILGPWDSDMAKNILNYKAPLAQKVLGARRGDRIDLLLSDAPGVYIVEAFENVLVGKETA